MENLTDKELDLALKLNKHKIFLQRFFVFSLFFVNLLIMYNLWYRWVIYSSQTPGFLHDQPETQNLINFYEYHERNRPITPSLFEQNNLASGKNTYDYYVTVRNANQRWLASRVVIDFRFPTETISKTISNLLPGESRLVATFGRPSDSPDAFLAEVKEISWQRLRTPPPIISEWIIIEDPRLESTLATSNYLETLFTLTNVSTFGFWQVPYTIHLYQGSTLIGLNEITTARLDPGERRLIKTLWSGIPIRPDRVEVIVDPSAILDEHNRYLAGQ